MGRKTKKQLREYQINWRATHREQIREYSRQWRLIHQHPCIDCGKPCSHVSVRCKACAFKGPLHRSWKGGRIIHQGYIYIWKPDHPRADPNYYVAEHILVWEQVHNKPLPVGWIIHHLNGIGTDNRPQNIVGLPNQKHKGILAAKAQRIQELEGLLNHQNQLL